MKLLFDQNLSPCLVDYLADIYPESTHVYHIGLDRAPDLLVWNFARDQGYVAMESFSRRRSSTDCTDLTDQICNIWHLQSEILQSSPAASRASGLFPRELHSGAKDKRT